MAGDEDHQPPNSPDATAALCDDTREKEDQAARLPGDVLADILRRVPPRWLAASRCVCTSWRGTVDGRRLLRADLLPLSLAGLFVHFDEHKYPEFLARPIPSSTTVSGDLSFLPSPSPNCGYVMDEDCVDRRDYNIENHCNGLLLLRNNFVVNPATRRWNVLPTCPTAKHGDARTHLVYDPTVSPHYEVFRIPILSLHPGDQAMEKSEWPPSLYKMHVFSSKSGCWEERCFVRQGDAEGTVSEMREGYGLVGVVYFRGALYAHSGVQFLMRLSLSNNTYSVIKPPTDLKIDGYLDINVARSKRGVYMVAFDGRWPRGKYWLGVWILDESCAQMVWVLKHNKVIKRMLPRRWFWRGDKWILEDINYNLFRASNVPKVNTKANAEEKFEWNSDKDVEGQDMVDHDDMKEVVENKLVWDSNNDNALNCGGIVEDSYRDEEHYNDSWDENIKILGFHPYKEIIFLSESERTCLAYHFNGSKIEELGNIYPKEYIYFKEISNEREMIRSVPYTPCWIEEFPGKN